MASKITHLTFILLLFSSSFIWSQTHLGPILGVKHGDLQAEATLDFFDLRTAPALGLLLKKETKHRLYFTAAISVEKTGWIETFDGNANLREVYLKRNAFTLSLGLGYYLIDSNKFKLGIASGIYSTEIGLGHFCYFFCPLSSLKNLIDAKASPRFFASILIKIKSLKLSQTTFH